MPGRLLVSDRVGSVLPNVVAGVVRLKIEEVNGVEVWKAGGPVVALGENGILRMPLLLPFPFRQ